MREITVTNSDSGGRLDKYLLRIMPKAGKSFIYKMIRKKNIKLNGTKADGNEILKAGDVLNLFLSDETIDKFSEKKEKQILTGEINIVYEDENVLLLNKQAGLLSQPSEREGKNADSLIGRVTSYLGADYSPALANRLDRNTSGLVMCGKNLAAVRSLNEVVFNGRVKKIYHAVVYGEVKKPERLSDRYFKDAAANTGHVTGSEGKEIITRYKPLAVKNGFSLLEIELETGRSHQIRVHLQSAGYPIIGDSKYGSAVANSKACEACGVRIRFQCLHAYKLVFNDNGKLAYLNSEEFTAKPPAVFAKVTEELFGHIYTYTHE